MKSDFKRLTEHDLSSAVYGPTFNTIYRALDSLDRPGDIAAFHNSMDISAQQFLTIRRMLAEVDEQEACPRSTVRV